MTASTDHQPPPGGRRVRPRGLSIVALIIATIPSLAYLGGKIHYHYIVNADHLLLPELMRDLADGGSVDRWAVPYATYLVPDWPLYAVALLVTPSASLAVAVFAFLQAVFLYFGLRRLAAVFDREWASLWALISLSIFVLYAASGSHPLVYLTAAYNHFGTAILVVWALAFTLDWVIGPTRRLLLLSGCTSGAAVLSDRIFIVWFLIPAALAVTALHYHKRLHRRELLQWLTVHTALSVAVLPISGLIFSTRSEYDVSFGFNHVRQGLSQFWENFTRVLENSPTVIPVVSLCIAIIGWQLRRGRSMSGRRIDARPSTFLAVFYAAAVVVTTLSQILMNGSPPGPRHSLALLMLPIALVPPVSLAGLAATRPVRSAAIALVCLPVFATVPVAASAVSDLDLDRSPVASDCIANALDSTGSDRGIANYWDARQVEVFSNGPLQLTPYNYLLYPDYTNASLDGFAEDYDFAVTSELHAGWQFSLPLLDHFNGPPLQRVLCDRWTISDWGDGGLRIPVFGAVGDTIEFDGCIMSSHLAAPDDNCHLTVDVTASQRDFLVFGPYAHVSPGEYRITVSYNSAQASQTEIGDWDVSIDTLPEPTLLAVGRAPGTDGQDSTITATVIVPPTKRATSVIEWHLVTDGEVAVTFQSLTIERIG